MIAEYRNDIDGLRAVAVLAVLFFHLDVQLFSGGYIGVDVFFVISGYLISKNILSEFDTTGGFSFKNFYIRRARRLFPALLVTVIITLITATMLFEPQYLKRVAGAAVYTIGFISNFYFWQEGGYFAVSSDYKPLLHTWSLSVEEQYYLFYPLGLVLIRKWFRPLTLIFLIFALIASLLISDYLYYDGKPYAVFFLLPTRIFEFLMGAVILFCTHNRKQPVLLNQLITVTGLAAILFAVFLYDSKTPNPTLYALIPCAGAAALLFSGPCSIRAILLENRVMTWTGKISYSLYLVHWPLIVFYGFTSSEELTVTTTALLFAASFLLASALHYLVEKPMRIGKHTDQSLPNHSKFIIGYLSLAMATLVISSIFWARGSLQWRNTANYLDRAEIAGFSETLVRTDNEAAFHKKNFSNSNSPKLLFIGDSHAEDSAFAVFTAAAGLDYEFEVLRFDSFCQPEQDYRHLLARTLAGLLGRKTQCDSQLQSLIDSPKVSAATHVFFANLSILKTAEQFPAHLIRLKENSKAKIILISQNANFPEVDNFAALKQTTNNDLNRHLYSIQSPEDHQIRASFRQLADSNDIYFLDRAALVCDEKIDYCYVDHEDTILYRDSTHWNHYGRQYYGKLFLDQLIQDGIL